VDRYARVEEMRASLLMLTWERFEITQRVLTRNLARTSIDYELLVCDQGSKDKRVIEMVDSFLPNYFRKNSKNEGCGKAFNQLFLRCTGDYIVLLGNDIELPEKWLEIAIGYLDLIPNSGLASFNWGHDGVPPVSTKFGIKAHHLNGHLNRCFGVTVFRRELIRQIGLFHEGFGPYGLEDSDLNERANMAGFNSFYVPNMMSEHLVHDVGENSDYRRMKDESMGNNLTIFSARCQGFHEKGVREPLPAMRDSL